MGCKEARAEEVEAWLVRGLYPLAERGKALPTLA